MEEERDGGRKSWRQKELEAEINEEEERDRGEEKRWRRRKEMEEKRGGKG